MKSEKYQNNSQVVKMADIDEVVEAYLWNAMMGEHLDKETYTALHTNIMNQLEKRAQ